MKCTHLTLRRKLIPGISGIRDRKMQANFQKQMVQSDWRGRGRTRKIEEEASQKNQADETGRGRHRRAIQRTGHAADRANIQKQTVQSDWRGRSRCSSTRKIEEEASQKNQADESSRGRHRRAIWRTGQAADRANIQKQTVRSDLRGRSRTWKIEEEASQRIRRMKPAEEGME